jgi:hypothetical protein
VKPPARSCGWRASCFQGLAYVGYLQLGIALTVAGVGTSLCFPIVANNDIGSPPPQEAGVASGTNGSLRELSGVFGVADSARHGVYASPQTFVDGFQPALPVGACLTAVESSPRSSRLDGCARTSKRMLRGRASPTRRDRMT